MISSSAAGVIPPGATACNVSITDARKQLSIDALDITAAISAQSLRNMRKIWPSERLHTHHSLGALHCLEHVSGCERMRTATLQVGNLCTSNPFSEHSMRRRVASTHLWSRCWRPQATAAAAPIFELPVSGDK
jgi:hypothetical protein